MTTVSSPEAIAALFADAHDDFPAIIGKPSDDDVNRLSQSNFKALQDINLGDGTDATGLILSKDDHKAATEANCLTNPMEQLRPTTPPLRTKTTTPSAYAKRKHGPASFIARRTFEPPSTWGRNLSSPAWKKRGWFA